VLPSGRALAPETHPSSRAKRARDGRRCDRRRRRFDARHASARRARWSSTSAYLVSREARARRTQVRPETPPGRRDATRERSPREVGLAPPLGPAGGIRGLLITNSKLAVLGDGARAPHGTQVRPETPPGRRDATRERSLREVGLAPPLGPAGAFAVSSSRTASSRCSATVLGRHTATPCSAFDARAPVPRLGTRAHTAPGRIPTSPSFGIRIPRLAQARERRTQVRPETPPIRRAAARERSPREVGARTSPRTCRGIRGLLITNSELAVLGDGARAPHGTQVRPETPPGRRDATRERSLREVGLAPPLGPAGAFAVSSSRTASSRCSATVLGRHTGRRCDRRRRRADVTRHASARRARWGSHLPSDLPGAFAVSSSRTASSRCSATVLGRHTATPCSAFDARAPVPRPGTRAHAAPGRTHRHFSDVPIPRLARRARETEAGATGDAAGPT
jgi:hypothetical protein